MVRKVLIDFKCICKIYLGYKRYKIYDYGYKFGIFYIFNITEIFYIRRGK